MCAVDNSHHVAGKDMCVPCRSLGLIFAGTRDLSAGFQ
jgi:hypothetical protein